MTFIQNNLTDYSVSQLCSALKFPRSTYCKALVRVPSNKQKEYEDGMGMAAGTDEAHDALGYTKKVKIDA